MARALVNGVESDRISIADRGLAYGDGLFETIAVRNGRPCLWDAHLHRLRRGARKLAIPFPPEALLLQEFERVAGDGGKCVVKLVLTRGTGGRGYLPPASVRPTRIFSRHACPDYPEAWTEEGVAVAFCRMTLAENPRLAGLKHLNRLEQVLARSECGRGGFSEGLMCDGRNRVIAGTMSNLFVLRGRSLSTPRLDTCGIAGTVRGLVLEMAAAFGLEPAERDLGPADLAGADGLFLTNALIGAWPVRRFADRRLDVRRLPTAFLQAVRAAAHSPDTETRDQCGYS